MRTGDLKERYSLLLDLLTPAAKTYPSEMGVLSVSQGLQVLGGYGFCDEFPLEQFYRDIRIHPIHEGSTGIQGMDLLGRKIVMNGGKAFSLFLEEVGATIKSAKNRDSLKPYAEKLDDALNSLRNTTFGLTKIGSSGRIENFLADATLYLELFSIVAIAWQWLKQGIVATRSIEASSGESDKAFYSGKLVTMKYFFHYELPKTKGLLERLSENDGLTVNFDENWLED